VHDSLFRVVRVWGLLSSMVGIYRGSSGGRWTCCGADRDGGEAGGQCEMEAGGNNGGRARSGGEIASRLATTTVEDGGRGDEMEAEVTERR